MSEIVRFNANIEIVPDTVDFEFADDQGRIAHSGTSNEVEGIPIAVGFKLAVTYDWPPSLPPGEYTVSFILNDGEQRHSVQQVIAGAPARVPDILCLTASLDAKDLPVTTGTWALYRGNEQVGQGTLTNGRVQADLGNAPSLDSYLLILTDEDGALLEIEVFYINPLILKAVKELRAYLDRLNRELRLSIMEFEDSDYLTWLKAGRDRFNSIPMATDFTMTAASGPIHSLWLVCSQVQALRTRYLEEGLASYSYSGASVSLDVDITAHLDVMLMALESRITDEGQRLKKNMHTRGLTSGTGAWSMSNNALGALGLTAGPVSGRGRLGMYPR